jgi:hypothetical protein
MSTLESTAGQDSAPPIDEQVMKLLEMAIADPPASARDAQLLKGVPQDRPQPAAAPSRVAAAGPSSKPMLPPLAPAPAPRRVFIGSFVRPVLGIGLLGLAAWALVPLLINVRSKQAAVNAPILTVCSPIDGAVTIFRGRESGARAGGKTPLLEVTNVLADGDRLATLNEEKTLLEARIASHRLQLAELARLQKNLSASAEKYRLARLRTLELERDGARAWLESVASVAKQRGSEEKMLDRLQASHSVSNQDAAATRFAAEAAQHAVVQARKAVENLEEQMRALQAGIHVGPGDGRNDLPYSIQRLQEIGLRSEEIRDALRQDEAKLAPLGRHIAAEAERFARQSRFRAEAPDNWVAWRWYVAGDAAVKAGTPLLAMIDPAEVFIDAVIPESDLKYIHPGDAAEVRIVGSDKLWKAEVSQVVGRTLPWPDRLLAAEAVPTADREVHALLRVREPLSGGQGAASLPVGLPAEVTFLPSARPLPVRADNPSLKPDVKPDAASAAACTGASGHDGQPGLRP